MKLSPFKKGKENRKKSTSIQWSPHREMALDRLLLASRRANNALCDTKPSKVLWQYKEVMSNNINKMSNYVYKIILHGHIYLTLNSDINITITHGL